MNGILNDVDQEVSDIVHHRPKLSPRLEASAHLEDKAKKEVSVYACIDIVEIEWHAHDVNDGLLAI